MEQETGSGDGYNSLTCEYLSLDDSNTISNALANNVHIEVSTRNQQFDAIIGHIEDLLIDDAFKKILDEFMEKHWMEFEDNEENKLCYMVIFQEYTNLIEKYIELHLVRRMPDFSMDSFTQSLQERKDHLDGEVFEILFTLSDFEAFKEMFLDYKAVKEGDTEDLTRCLTVTSVTLDSGQRNLCENLEI